VPVTEIRRIEFGLHTSEALLAKIEAAIRQLTSDSFPQREEATKELIGYGAAAYPALKIAAVSSDQEVMRRAKAAMDRIRDRVPAAKLNVRPDDFMQTNEFPVQGRIVQPTLKARTAYFGDRDLQIADLRAIRWTMGGNDTHEFALDPGPYSNQDMSQWLDTGIVLEDAATITAAGQININPNNGNGYMTGPAGHRNYQANNGLTFRPGALLGKIGEDGTTFLVGERHESAKRAAEGKLYLQVMPGPWGNPFSGAYKIKVAGGRKENAD
jgi:hypothetical protein